MKRAAEQLIRRYTMLPEGKTVLAAVSGGMDSMCLLHFLCARGETVAAAHFNHHLRGAESDGDEVFVREYCASRGIPFYAGGADVAALAAQEGLTLEEAGRRARYEFLEHTAREAGAARIATAHHAQDNAETVLFHLVRGSGTEGLCGIPPVRGALVRPLLTATKEQIARYARENGVPYRTDSTNADTAFTRNFIRAEVLAKLKKVNANAISHMSDAALRLRRESAYLDELARGYLAQEARAPGRISLSCAIFASAPEALRPRMLRLLLDDLGVGKKDMTAAHIDALAALGLPGGSAQRDLPNGVRARRHGGVLTLCTDAAAPAPLTLREGESIAWGKYTISLQKADKNRPLADDIFYLRYDTIENRLTVGAWSARERMTLPGKLPRSLKRLFADAGISPLERDGTPVIRAGGRPAAVPGLGTDEAFLPERDGDAIQIKICATTNDNETSGGKD